MAFISNMYDDSILVGGGCVLAPGFGRGSPHTAVQSIDLRAHWQVPKYVTRYKKWYRPNLVFPIRKRGAIYNTELPSTPLGSNSTK